MTIYRASDYMSHPEALAMVRQDGGQATPEAAALYVAMREADAAGDMGNTYYVNTNAGTVELVDGYPLTSESPTLDYADVYTSADVSAAISDANGGKLPDYYHVFDAAMFLMVSNYRHHLQDFVEGDENNEPRAFYFQSVPVECMRSEDDEFYAVEPIDGTPYGWALLASAATR